MRDKKRIRILMEKLQEYWETSNDLCFYKLLYSLYHDIPDQWNYYYKEDDFWQMEIENSKLDNLSKGTSKKLSKVQKEILNTVVILWEDNCDLRFPQLCNLIYSKIVENAIDKDNIQVDDVSILQVLQKEVGVKDNE